MPARTFDDILKFNPYHDAKGRFASANSYASFTYAPGKSKAHDMAIAREQARQATASNTSNQTAAPSSNAPSSNNTAVNQTSQKKHRSDDMDIFEKEDAIMEDTGVDEDTAFEYRQAVKAFTTDDDDLSNYADVRSYQTTGDPQDAKASADTLEEFIAKSPKWDGGKVYRVISVDKGTAQSIIQNANAGNSFGQQGISSWTTSENIANGFKGSKTNIKFISKGKQNGTSVHHLSDMNEEEVIMSNNARWKPTKVTQKSKNEWEIECVPT